MSDANAVNVAAGLSPEAAKMGRWMDIIIIPTVLFVLIGAFHIHYMVLAGDWDFWADWKDREYWTVVTPIVAITFPVAVQNILWRNFRLPFGATLCIAGLLLGEWLVRIFGFGMWSSYPINLVMPSQQMGTALILDAVLLLMRGNWIFTGVFGGALYGVLFYPMNYPQIAPLHEPVNYQGVVLSLADLMGFMDVRTGTPEYIRMIERGTLRTFGGHSTAIAAIFAGFICIMMYWLWWYLGGLFSNTAYIIKGVSTPQIDTAAEVDHTTTIAERI